MKFTICACCREECIPIKLDNSFSYAGTHCTHGRDGIHYPAGYGAMVSNCCEDDVISPSGEKLDWEDLDYA